MIPIRKIISLLFLVQLLNSESVYPHAFSFADPNRNEKQNYFHPKTEIDNNFSKILKKCTNNQLFEIKEKTQIPKYLNPKPNHTPFVIEPENANVLGMFLMLGYGKLRYNIYEKAYYTMDYSITKGGGVSYEIPLEALDGKFSVYNELGFSLFKSEAKLHYADTIGGDPVNNYYDVNLLFSPNTVFLSNTLRYCLTKSEFEYYVSIGISNSFVVSSTNTKETLHTIQGSTERYVDEFVPDPAIHGISVLISTGFSYKNIGFEMRFDPGRNYSNQIHYAVYMPSVLG